MTDSTTAAERLPWTLRFLPVALFGVFTAATLIIVVAAVGVAIWSYDELLLWAAVGDLGAGVLKDASWLFPSFVAILFALAVVPGRLSNEADIEEAYKQRIIRLMPMVVGVAATMSLALVVVGVVQRPETAPSLFSPLLLSVVTVGVAYVLTTALVRRPSYRIAQLKGQIDEVDVAYRQTRDSHRDSRRERAFPASLKAAGFALAVPAALLIGHLMVQQRWDAIPRTWLLLLVMAALAAISTAVDVLVSYEYWTSRRRPFDRVFLAYTYLTPTALAVLVVVAGASSAEPLWGILLILPMLIPTVLTWVPGTYLPRFMRQLSVHAASGGTALRVLAARRRRLRKELEQLRLHPAATAEQEHMSATAEVA